MDDQQLLRYSRHILLPKIGVEGQQKLLQSHALVIGAGGLGCFVAQFLTAGGVGNLTLVDNDAVDLTNLQRQVLYRMNDIGIPKAHAAQAALLKINPGVNVTALCERVDEARLLKLAADADVVLDCSDNFTTRYAINRVCIKLKKPLVSGAAIRFDGQAAVFDLRRAGTPCYNCLYPEHAEAAEERCAVMGVFAPLVGIIGSVQAAEALKLLSGAGASLCGRLLVMDALAMRLRTVEFDRDPACSACAA